MHITRAKQTGTIAVGLVLFSLLWGCTGAQSHPTRVGQESAVDPEPREHNLFGKGMPTGRELRPLIIGRLDLSLSPGFYMQLELDGSGTFGWGASGADSFAFPPGAFDFQSVYFVLVKTLSTDQSLPGAQVQIFRGNGDDFAEDGNSVFVCTDAHIVRKLFERARASCPGVPTRFPQFDWPDDRDNWDEDRNRDVAALSQGSGAKTKGDVAFFTSRRKELRPL